jgi:hypothetical protein
MSEKIWLFLSGMGSVIGMVFFFYALWLQVEYSGPYNYLDPDLMTNIWTVVVVSFAIAILGWYMGKSAEKKDVKETSKKLNDNLDKF